MFLAYSENNGIFRYGWPEDLWFHVDDLSSAHVYLRLPRGDSFETVPEEVVEECASLVKANSIKVLLFNLYLALGYATNLRNLPRASLKRKVELLEVAQLRGNETIARFPRAGSGMERQRGTLMIEIFLAFAFIFVDILKQVEK